MQTDIHGHKLLPFLDSSLLAFTSSESTKDLQQDSFGFTQQHPAITKY